MNILYLLNSAPGDMSFGGAQRNSRLYDALTAVGNVYCIHFGTAERDNERIKKATFSIASGWRAHINGLWMRLYRKLVPMQWWEKPIWMPCRYETGIRGLFPGVKFDCVVARHFPELGWAHLWNLGPVFVDMDDTPLQLFETLHAGRLGWCRRWIARLLMRYSIANVERHVDGGWVSRNDQFGDVHFKSRPFVLPNIPNFPSPGYLPVAERKNYIFTIGSLNYAPNIDGIDVFLRDIWPKVHEAYPMLEYLIAGKFLIPDNEARWSAVEGVKVVGFVDDLTDLYRHALACVVPVEKGSGTCIKTLEAMAYSRVCLATPFGARGIPDSDLVDGRAGVLVYRNADGFMRLFGQLDSDVGWRRTVEQAGRRYAEENYSAAAFLRQVERGLESGFEAENGSECQQ